jgi:flagellar biosynthesis/type III secretory pathway chaperone
MLTNIPSATLRQLVKLSERKETLMAQIQEIDREMVRLQNQISALPANIDNPAPVTVSRAPRKSSFRNRKRKI